MSEVLVVGSGPSGLALACELYRRGVPCRVIDQQKLHVDRSRAVDVQPRTLHYLDDLGAVDGLLTRGRLLRGLSVYDRSIRLARIDYRAADTPFPFAVAIPQSETEQTLERKLGALGGRVERGVTLRRLAQDDDGVQVWLHDSDGESCSTYRWVVGCDGVASTVRDASGIAFTALAAPQSFVAADAVVRWRYPNDELALFLFEDSFLLALPLLGDGCMRLIADVGADEDKPMQLEAFAAMASERIGTEVWLEEPGFVGTYHARRRLASAFRDRRVLIVGDAAHTYNPIGGHGMNQGIQDAYNLGWKLALVVSGRSDEGLLDSYEAERRAVARDFARDMDFGARLALSNQDVSREERDRLLDFAVKSPSVRRAVLDSALPHLSVYDESPIVGEVLGRGFASPSGTSAGSFAPDVRAGAGAPSIVELSRGTEHLLLLFCGADDVGASAVASVGGEVRERFGDVVRVVLVAGGGSVTGWDGRVLTDAGGAVHARYGAVEPCAYLMRPDGHIGFRACPLEVTELLDYLGRLFTG